MQRWRIRLLFLSWKILPNGVEIFLKTEGSTFYFQSPLPYLCTCTITVDAKRKDLVEERKSERQMKIETSRKFLDCTIIAYPFLINGYNFVLQTSWKMEIAYKNGTAIKEIPMKEEYGLSMLLASGFLQGCAAKHESGRWGLHQWLLSCGGVCKQNGTANQGMVFLLIGCNRQKEALFLMPNYWDMKGWRATVSCRLDCAIKMELRVVAIKVSRCQHGKQRKVLGSIVLKYFKAYRQGFFVPCHSRRKLVWDTRTVFLRRRLTFIQNTRKDENMQTK